MPELRSLVLVLGDQLDIDSSAFDGFDPALDAVWMAEVAEESTHVWSSKPRIALFLSAMRHFAETLRKAGRTVHYSRLDDAGAAVSMAAALQQAVTTLKPRHLVLCAPGDWRVLRSIREVAARAGLGLDLRDDRHFFCTVREFAAHASGRKTLRLEPFYRLLRARHRVLMEDGQPLGGRWNFDADNRAAFGSGGPPARPATACW